MFKAVESLQHTVSPYTPLDARDPLLGRERLGLGYNTNEEEVIPFFSVDISISDFGDFRLISKREIAAVLQALGILFPPSVHLLALPNVAQY